MVTRQGMSDLMEQGVSHLGFAVEFHERSREVDGALAKVTETESAPSPVEGEGPVVEPMLAEQGPGKSVGIGKYHRTSLSFRASV
jgi:hypothetical protein